jgi:hypothetical protein
MSAQGNALWSEGQRPVVRIERATTQPCRGVTSTPPPQTRRKQSTMPIANLMEQIASDEALEEAYRWFCDRRKNCSPNNDVWTLRWRWRLVKPQLQERLVAGNYCFEPLYRIPDSPDNVELWSARDSLVLKAMAIVLTRHLAPLIPKTCYHLLGNGGAKRAVSDMVRQLPAHAFVFRSDVQDYYASIDREILIAELRRHITDLRVIELVWQYLRRTIYDQGKYEDMRQGIALGCSLSPLIGAFSWAEGPICNSHGHRPWDRSALNAVKPQRGALRASAETTSIPRIPLVERNLVLVQERAKLILKRMSAMMFLLLLNVLDHLVGVRRADGKRSVATLPMKAAKICAFGLDPFRRAGFQCFDHLGNRFHTRQIEQDVNVISRPVDRQREAAVVFENSCAIGVQLGFNGTTNHRFTVFRAEDEMNENRRQRLRHRHILRWRDRSPRWGL